MSSFGLRQLRESRATSQVAVASAMGVSQSAVSKIERRDDVSVAALRDYIAALGGAMEIHARFPDGVVPLALGDAIYSQRAPLQKVAERAPEIVLAMAPVVAPEWLDEADRIRAMTPLARMQELANGAAFFARARRRA
ncbi:MAG: helix-turn-helix transcriptional regulator [Gemmatimonadaceae bacterium]